MKYKIELTKQFKKDLKLAKKQNKKLDKLYLAINILVNGRMLSENYKDHGLVRKYKGAREAHIEPDWLLVYEIVDDKLILMLYRVGTHSYLFQ